ncbi:MAG: nucleotidyltransferase domain-containing protein, partial [Anaerolineae bacterium]|nr:nucleotidyltransferase domain-containing protein [Anaerolineae bacterium]
GQHFAADALRNFHIVDESIAGTVRQYIAELTKNGLPIDFAVVFGSQARDRSTSLSDIDLLVVSPKFDQNRFRQDVDLLWRVAARTDSRIEPIAVGVQQFEEDDSSAIVEIARREGQKVYPAL